MLDNAWLIICHSKINRLLLHQLICWLISIRGGMWRDLRSIWDLYLSMVRSSVLKGMIGCIFRKKSQQWSNAYPMRKASSSQILSGNGLFLSTVSVDKARAILHWLIVDLLTNQWSLWGHSEKHLSIIKKTFAHVIFLHWNCRDDSHWGCRIRQLAQWPQRWAVKMSGHLLNYQTRSFRVR